MKYSIFSFVDISSISSLLLSPIAPDIANYHFSKLNLTDDSEEPNLPDEPEPGPPDDDTPEPDPGDEYFYRGNNGSF